MFQRWIPRERWQRPGQRPWKRPRKGQRQLRTSTQSPRQRKQEARKLNRQRRKHPVSVSSQRVDPSSFYHTPDNFRAGAVRSCLPKWKQITNDKWVLDIVKGYRLELWSEPWQEYRPQPRRLENNSQKQLDDALLEFLRQGIIEPCDFDEEGFYSTLFPISKR